MNQTSKNVTIGSMLISLLFGVVGAFLAYQYMDFPLTYTDFIAGSITWDGEGKSKDVSMIFGFMIIASLSLFGISKFRSWIESHYDEDAAQFFSIVLIYTSIPFVMWLGGQVLSKADPYYDPLFFYAWIVFGGMLTTYITLKNYVNEKQSIPAHSLIIFSFLTFTFATLSPDVLGILLTKSGKGQGSSREILMYAWYYVPALWIAVLYSIKNKIAYFRYSSLIFQLAIIGYFALLIPSAYITEGQVAFFPIKNLLYIVIGSLVAIGIYDIVKRFIQNNDSKELSLSLLSPFPLPAILILTFLSGSAMLNVSGDDYHFGEKLLPFYMMSKYHIVPYTDYALAHGFIDVLPAIGSSLFLDGTASTLNEGNRILTALIVIGSFLVAYRYIGLLAAFLLTLFVIPIGMWYFIAIVMSLIIINIKAEKLGIVFFLIASSLFFLAPGQGTVFIIAILPLVAYRVWSSKTIFINLKSLMIPLIIIAGLIVIMPWILDMTLSAVGYVLENGPVNFQAYGIAWHHSWDSGMTINSSLAVYEIIRTSWAFIPIFVLTFWLMGYYKEKKEAFFYALFAVIFILIMYKYSMGRIDAFGLSRQGLMSLATIPLLFLCVYFLDFSKQKFAYWALILTFWIGLLTPSYVSSPIVNAKPTIPDLGVLTKGNEINIPQLGNAITDPVHIARTIAIKKIVDQFLNKNETFVDITNRGGLYFYLDRRMPIEAVPYNQPHPQMQQRSIDRLTGNPPPMALLQADNITHDGGPVSIRAHLLYRWIMDNYIPVMIDNVMIGVQKNEIERFSQRFPEITLPKTEKEQLLLWDKIFLQQDLRALPSSWGDSQKTLNKKMKIVQDVDVVTRNTHDIQITQKGKYQSIGANPFIVYDISQSHISGKNAGILSFDFACDNDKAKSALQVFYSTDIHPIEENTSISFIVHNGHVMVPLDAMPSWYMSKYIQQIRIDVQNPTEYGVFTIKNIKLNQRILNDK